MAVAALRPDRADRALRRRELSSGCRKPYRSYRSGWVFRNEKPGPGRFRQFMQFDADTIGTPGVAADAEMAMMMADVMEALGIERGDYVIRVNNRKVLDGVLEAIGLGGDENAGRRLTVLRAIDKLDKFGPKACSHLLGQGRWDGGRKARATLPRAPGWMKTAIERVLALHYAQLRSTTPTMRRPSRHDMTSGSEYHGVPELPLSNAGDGVRIFARDTVRRTRACQSKALAN